MVLLCQIKARVVIQIVRMENLPFLSKSDQPSQSRNGPQSENEWPIQDQPPRPMFQGHIETPTKDPLEFLKIQIQSV